MRQHNVTLKGAFGSVTQTPWEWSLRSLFERVGGIRTTAMGDRPVFVRLFLCQIERRPRPGHGKRYDYRPSDDGFFCRSPPLGILTRHASRKHDKHD